MKKTSNNNRGEKRNSCLEPAWEPFFLSLLPPCPLGLIHRITGLLRADLFIFVILQ